LSQFHYITAVSFNKNKGVERVSSYFITGILQKKNISAKRRPRPFISEPL